MRGMILAAGAGSRMQPLTVARAKPSLPVLGTPLVARAARLLAGAGIREIAVNLHHHGDTIRAALEPETRAPGDAAGLRFTWSPETELLGTGGGIGRVAGWLAEGGTAIVVNSDFLADFDFAALLSEHRSRRALGTLVVVPPNGPFPGELWTATDGRVTGFGASPPASDGGSEPSGGSAAGPFEFTGCHVLEPELLRRFPDRVCDSVRDVYPSAIAEGRLFAHRHPGWWWEFGSLDRFLHGQLQMIHVRRLVDGGEIVETDDGGRAWLAPGAQLEPGAIVRGIAVLNAGARIAAGATVENSILLDGAQVLEGVHVRRCLIAPGTVLEVRPGADARFQGLAVARAIPGSPPPAESCRARDNWWVRDIPAPAGTRP